MKMATRETPTRLTGAALCALAIASCRAPVPVGAASAADFDERLIGVWEVLDDQGRPAFEAPILIMRFSETEYLGGTFAADDETVDPESATRLYITAIGRHRFLNMQLLEAPEDLLFVRLENVDQDELRVQLLAENAFSRDDMSSRVLADFVAENAENPEVFPPDGSLTYRRLSRDHELRRPEPAEFEVEFGLLERFGGLIEQTTTIPLLRCDSFSFGFDVSPPNSLSYDYYTVTEFPSAPAVIGGSGRFDPGPPAKLSRETKSARGGKILAFSFDDGDPLGAYRASLYLNGKLHSRVDYHVVQPSTACAGGSSR